MVNLILPGFVISLKSHMTRGITHSSFSDRKIRASLVAAGRSGAAAARLVIMQAFFPNGGFYFYIYFYFEGEVFSAFMSVKRST